MEFLYMLLDMVIVYVNTNNDNIIFTLRVIAVLSAMVYFFINVNLIVHKENRKKIFKDEYSYIKEEEFNRKLLKISFIILIISSLLLIAIPRKHTIEDMLKVRTIVATHATMV